MFVLANFLFAAASVLGMVITLYIYVIIARAIISWVNPDPYNPIVRFLYNATEPVLYRVRRTFPFAYLGGIDFSPMHLHGPVRAASEDVAKRGFGHRRRAARLTRQRI